MSRNDLNTNNSSIDFVVGAHSYKVSEEFVVRRNTKNRSPTRLTDRSYERGFEKKGD